LALVAAFPVVFVALGRAGKARRRKAARVVFESQRVVEDGGLALEPPRVELLHARARQVPDG
jgi:hypothetical protein